MTTFQLVLSLVKIVLVVGFVVNIAAILSWAERRQSAMMQDRVGPNRADMTIFGKQIRLGGLLHPVADAIKMFFKEDFVPPNSDKLLHALAPILSLFPPLVVLAVVPIADTLCLDSLREYKQGGAPVWHLFSTWTDAGGIDHHPWVERFGTCAQNVANGHMPAVNMQILDFNPGVLFIFALAGLGIVGASIAGWASDNKFSLLGGLRAASQLVSYEVAMGLSLVGCMMIYGTIRLDDMAHWQSEHTWGIFVQPLAFLLFFTAATAESKRAPFDLPEGESEIVAGYMVEYSGMKFGMFYTGEFIEVATSSAFMVAVFLGGYNLPFLHRDGISIALGGEMLWQKNLPHLLVILLQAGTFFTKVIVVCWFQLFVRWSLPRFRYDQLMKLGWRIMLPAALANVFLTGIILLAFDRASLAFQESMQTIGDYCTLLTGVAMIGAVLWIVIGYFVPTDKIVRPHAFFPKKKRLAKKAVPAASEA